ncbi:hypothetical protein [Candidatus Methylobacter oryzae]|uniref:Uncharacterized protein n=1 Tax=Candidatus Methylobacter oryzae TaxID=2497749 RepID=A0ABY3CAY9_9GAMM|nr:hypothetical protein [Candidatus Methylobacter oryzae]TRW95844.1 hypothetical protein EKO24_009575 [Candidatus Methylobacter oryzae]
MTDDESAAYEAEILKLWDELPDYAKTQSLLDKLKDRCPPSLMKKLQKRERNTPLIIADDNEGDEDL